jgi:hypothetical protein
MEFVDRKILAATLRPSEYVSIIDYARLKANKQTKIPMPQCMHLPVAMFEPYKDRIMILFGRTLPNLAEHRGLTAGEAYDILMENILRPRNNDYDQIVCIPHLQKELENWLHVSEMAEWVAGCDAADANINSEQTPSEGGAEFLTPEEPVAEPLPFSLDELIASVDRPGFAWDNLSKAEQRNLSESLSSFVTEQIRNVDKKVGAIAVSYRWRVAHVDYLHDNFGEYSPWEVCSFDKYQEIKGYRDSGHPHYEVQRLAVIEDETQADKLATLFDAIKHGDEDHQGWLKQAIEAHFADRPMPLYVAGVSSKDQLNIQLADWESRTEWFTRDTTVRPSSPLRRRRDVTHVADLMREEILHLRSLICTLPKLVLLGWYINWPPNEIGAIRFIGAEGWELKERLERTKPGISFVEHWGEERYRPPVGPDPWPEMYISHCELLDHEPHFVLKGRDPQAPALIEKWASDRALANPDHFHKVASALKIAKEMRHFKNEYPELGLSAQALENIGTNNETDVSAPEEEVPPVVQTSVQSYPEQ